MSPPAQAVELVQSLDITLNGLLVGTLVRTPGDFNAFSLSESYRALKDPPVLSLSLRAEGGGLRLAYRLGLSGLPGEARQQRFAGVLRQLAAGRQAA